MLRKADRIERSLNSLIGRVRAVMLQQSRFELWNLEALLV
jgi:hypothetical protein